MHNLGLPAAKHFEFRPVALLSVICAVKYQRNATPHLMSVELKDTTTWLRASRSRASVTTKRSSRKCGVSSRLACHPPISVLTIAMPLLLS